jgi:hypothetical protein
MPAMKTLLSVTFFLLAVVTAAGQSPVGTGGGQMKDKMGLFT